MDKKEEQLFKYFYNKFVSGDFDEKDVYSFLILARSYAPNKSPVREFGDFIAHREKDRGFIKDYLLKIKNIVSNLGKIGN